MICPTSPPCSDARQGKLTDTHVLQLDESIWTPGSAYLANRKPRGNVDSGATRTADTVDLVRATQGPRNLGEKDMSEELLKELIAEAKNLHESTGIMQRDANCIRNGEYDSPSGARSSRPSPLMLEDIKRQFNS